MSDNDSRQKSGLRIAGSVAGLGSGLSKVAVGHGFDTVKVRMQLAPKGTYTGALDVLRHILRNEGPRALYKGATPPFIGQSAIDSILLGSLHNYRLFLFRNGMTEPIPGLDTQRLTLLGHGVAGLCAGLTSAFLATPIEMLKVRLQLQTARASSHRQFKGPIDCARQIIRAEGILGMWRGMSASLAFRSNFFWMFLSFEALMRGFTSLNGTRWEISTGAANFLSGGFSSFVYWICAAPADNVKSRMMSRPLSTPSPSFFAVARQVYSAHGYPGFFRGLTPILARAFPTNACAFAVYEGLMRAMGAEKTRQ